jgi:hypothetical protein
MSCSLVNSEEWGWGTISRRFHYRRLYSCDGQSNDELERIWNETAVA